MTLVTAEEYGRRTGKACAEIDADLAAGVVNAQRVGWAVYLDVPDVPAKPPTKKRRKDSPSTLPVPGVDG